MTNENNGAARAVVNAIAVPRHEIIALRLQAELFQQALKRSLEAAETLVQRQVVAMPMTDDPDFRRNLISDVLAVSTTLAGLSADTDALLAAIQHVAPAQPVPASA